MTDAARAPADRRILAFDTSTWTCSVALSRGGAVLAERSEHAAASHAETLPRVVAAVLEEAGERPVAGDAVAVAIGPGSFTGLRIGLAFAKGLAFARGLRIVGVPTLDARALAVPAWQGRLCAVLDARKREVYAALYERTDGRVVRRGEPCTITAARLAELVPAPCTFVGEGVEVYGEVFRAGLGAGATLLPGAAHPPRAGAVGQLAAARLAARPDGDDLPTLAPAYVRPPEAELVQSQGTPSARVPAPPFVDKVPLVY